MMQNFVTCYRRVFDIPLWLPVGLAAVFFFLLFRGIYFDFWVQITLSVIILCLTAWFFDSSGFMRMFKCESSGQARMVFIGILSAAVLYLVFWAGNIVSRAVLPFSGAEIEDIYSLKQGMDTRVILGLLLVIGPGEEIFWRGFVQRRLSVRKGTAGMILSILIYGLVHVPSGSVMLICAALICGTFWGLLYRYYDSILLNAVSHTFWDVAVFIIWPFTA